jgi:nitrogenase molybdenum-iron protein alpha chain
MSVVNLKANEVPIRELRLGSITGFSGSASELVGCARRGALRERARGFSQCLGCSTANAACTVILIQDGAVISHGPVGCSACYHEFAFTYLVNGAHRGVENPTPRRIFSTNLGERETVYGGNERLAETIREVRSRTGANAIFIVTTCASGISGTTCRASPTRQRPSSASPWYRSSARASDRRYGLLASTPDTTVSLAS